MDIRKRPRDLPDHPTQKYLELRHLNLLINPCSFSANQTKFETALGGRGHNTSIKDKEFVFMLPSTFQWSKLHGTPIVLVVSDNRDADFNMAEDFGYHTNTRYFTPNHIIQSWLKDGSTAYSSVSAERLCFKRDGSVCTPSMRQLICNNRQFRTALFLRVSPKHINDVPAYIRASVDWMAVQHSNMVRTPTFRNVWGFTLHSTKYPTITYIRDKRRDGAVRPQWTYQLRNELERLMYGYIGFVTLAPSLHSTPLTTVHPKKVKRRPKVYHKSVASQETWHLLRKTTRRSLAAKGQAIMKGISDGPALW
jgi:hypothetical protein